jgi:TfoX/Sxy family transcriptional regulator of competence genes
MAYDETLAGRLRDLMGAHRGVVEKKMFGGLAFMVRGHMAFGVVGDELMVRVGPDGHDEALAQPHARPMDFTGRPLRGMVYVARAGIARRAALASWVDRALRFNASQPARTARPRAPGKKR